MQSSRGGAPGQVPRGGLSASGMGRGRGRGWVRSAQHVDSGERVGVIGQHWLQNYVRSYEGDVFGLIQGGTGAQAPDSVSAPATDTTQSAPAADAVPQNSSHFRASASVTGIGVTVNVKDGRLKAKRKRTEFEVAPRPDANTMGASTSAEDNDEQAHDLHDEGLAQWDESDDNDPPAPSKSFDDTRRPPKRQRVHTGRRNTIELLREHRNVLLREWTRHEGLHDCSDEDAPLPPCTVCCARDDESEGGLLLDAEDYTPGDLRCIDCHLPGLLCASCMVKCHQHIYLHRIERYNGEFFEPYTLREAGLILELGHDGRDCLHRKVQDKLLIVIDVSGIHRVRYALCGCDLVDTSDPVVQMMRARLWPSSAKNPRTVATFSTLRLFHALAVQGKVNMYDFYQGIVRVTNNVKHVKASYIAFSRCVRLFRHIRMAKRAGAAQKPKGVDDISPGEVALRCPACPRPGINLPVGWENAPPHERYLYSLLLAIDANFKLKMKDRGANNVTLGDGWGFFVENAPYMEHLDKHTDLTEMKHCASEHNALRNSNMPTSKRWCVNGVGATICARHLLYLALGVVDLPRGERYACMDWGVFSSLGATAKELKTILFSYDISCSWSVNFHERLQKFYQHLWTLPDDARITFVVPKFHLEAHGEDCKCAYNLNHTAGSGRTCGEGIEAGWAELNSAGVFTREMGHAHRHEVLDDNMQAINWRKIKTMDQSLLKQLREALPMAEKQRNTLADHEKQLPEDILANWEDVIEEWDNEPVKKGKPSPYRPPICTQSLADVKLELAREEGEELEAGLALNEVSASAFISSVIALEDVAHTIELKAKKTRLTPQDNATLAVRRNQAFHRAQALEEVQASYLLDSATLARRIEALPSASASQPTVATQANPTSANPPVATGSANTTTPPCLPPLVLETAAETRRRGRTSGSVVSSRVTLSLPSNIPAELRIAISAGDIVPKEIRMRIAVCKDSLHNTRRALRQSHAYYVDSKKYGFKSQRMQTRSITSRLGIREALNRHVSRYRRSYNALLVLDPDNEYQWRDVLQELKASDLRAPMDEDAVSIDPGSESDDMDAAAGSGSARGRGKRGRGGRRARGGRQRGRGGKRGRVSDGRRQDSWIWRADAVEMRDVPGATTIEEAYEHTRIDWARQRSRAFRWFEECSLVLEEMRRVVCSHAWTVEEWRARADASEELQDLPVDIRRGLRSHALRQSDVYKSLAIGCMKTWIPFLLENDLDVEWPDSLQDEAEMIVAAYKAGLPEEAEVEPEEEEDDAEGGEVEETRGGGSAGAEARRLAVADSDEEDDLAADADRRYASDEDDGEGDDGGVEDEDFFEWIFGPEQ